MIISCCLCPHFWLRFYQSSSFPSLLPHPTFTLFPACGPWQSFQPSHPASVDVRPGLIDQTINCPCITSLLLVGRLACRLRPHREKKRGVGWGAERGGRERVSSKLLIKYKSIVCHLSGHASTSPFRGGWGVGKGGGSERWGKSIRQTEGRDKCLIHQSNYIIAIMRRQLDVAGWTGCVHVSASFSPLQQHSERNIHSKIEKLYYILAWKYYLFRSHILFTLQ